MTKASILLFAALLPALASAAEPSARLKVTRNADGEVVATASGSVRACGITAIGDAPTFKIDGTAVDVHQSMAGVACVNPPPQTKPYKQQVNLGKLPPGTYTIRWNYPELSATYTVK